MDTLLRCLKTMPLIFTICFICLQLKCVMSEEMINVAQTSCMRTRCRPYSNDFLSHIDVTETIFGNAEPTQLCCGLCICTSELCHIYGKECVETEKQLSAKLSPFIDSFQTCFRLDLKNQGSIPKSNTYVYINNVCPVNYHSDAAGNIEKMNVIDRCENAENYASFSTRLPVLDRRVGLSFVNIYCARCNGVPDDDTISYSVRIACRDDLYWPTNIDSIVSDVLQDNSCNLLYEEPMANGTHTESLRCTKSHLDTCNVNVTTTCYSDDSDQVQGALCHVTHDRDQDKSQECLVIETDSFSVPFSRLLRLETIDIYTEIAGQLTVAALETTINCGNDEFFDTYKKTCRSLSCAAPWALKSGSCELFVNTVTGIDFEVFLKLTSLNEEEIDILHAGSSIDKTQTFIQHILNRKLLEDTSAFKVYVYSTTDIMLGEELLFPIKYALFHIQIGIPIDMAIEASFMDDFLNLNGKEVRSEIDGAIELFKLELVLCETINGTLRDAYSQDELILYDVLEGDHFIPIPQEPVITILSITGCPLVTLDTTEYTITHDPYSLTISELQFTIMYGNYKTHHEHDGVITVEICADVYESTIMSLTIINEVISVYGTSSSPKSIILTVQLETLESSSILSVICLSISIFCSALTLLTYVLFKDMRTQPGINNMALSISLILAQTLFLFGIGQKGNIPDLACSIIGVFVHFSTLMVIMWMNVCSFHTFKLFWTINNGRNNSGSVQITSLYTVYTITLSVCPVTVNIVVSMVSENGSVGYGEHLCYISSSTMIIVTFALPVAIVVLANIVLFCLTVIRIRKSTTTVSKRSKDRNYFAVYCRLSTMCGCLWLFGILYMFTGNVVLEFLFILSNATQGTYLFLAFVFNKACARQYLNLVCRGRPTSVIAQATQSTRVRHISVMD